MIIQNLPITSHWVMCVQRYLTVLGVMGKERRKMAKITHKNALNCWEYFIKNNQFKANEVVGTEDKTKEENKG